MSRKKVKEEIEKSESRKKVVRTFRRAGFDVTYMRDGKWTSDVSIMYLKPNEDIAQILGSSLEVVALLAEFPDFDARSVEEVREEVDTGSGEVRLSTEVAFVVTEDENTGEEVREINKRYRNLHTQLVGFSLSEIERCKPYGSEDFIRNLQLRFYSRDLYQPRGPVLSPVNFFGREEMVSELTSELRSGTGHVGVFGLRKMGKTSLLYRLVDTLRRDAKVAHAHIDLQRVVAVNPSPEYLLWTIAEKLLDENQFLQDKVDYRLFGEYSLFSDIQEKENVFESFSHDINRLIKSQDRIKFVFMLDEIELLSHNVESAPWEGEDFVRFWRFLRGMDQENPGRFSYFVTGTNPSAIEDNKIVLEEEGYGSKKSIDNPTYNYFTKKYLPPLTSQENGNGECGELLNDLGHRMGLVWSEEAIDQLAEYVGGHPSLLRHYASMVHNKLSPRSQKERVDADLVRSLAPDFIRNRESDFSQMTDVLREQYEDEYFLLQLAAEGRVGEFREWAKASPEDVAHRLCPDNCVTDPAG
jgi:serine/threonine-protein kinase